MIVYDVGSLCKTYRGQTGPANTDISFQVRQGEIFGVLGENGVGLTVCDTRSLPSANRLLQCFPSNNMPFRTMKRRIWA